MHADQRHIVGCCWYTLLQALRCIVVHIVTANLLSLFRPHFTLCFGIHHSLVDLVVSCSIHVEPLVNRSKSPSIGLNGHPI